MEDDSAIALSALQHYLYCPRQCALIHVEQLWAESRHTAEGRILHEKADKPRMERRKGVRTVMAMPLSETQLGISGIADVVEFHQQPGGERAFPVEYKRGRPKAHRADEVQLCAQALCLESRLERVMHFDEPALALRAGDRKAQCAAKADALASAATPRAPARRANPKGKPGKGPGPSLQPACGMATAARAAPRSGPLSRLSRARKSA